MKSPRQRILEEAHSYVPYDTERKGLDVLKMTELHDLIERGVVDIGPTTDHSEPVKDIRYMGPDAEELGAAILARSNGNGNGNGHNRDLPELRNVNRVPE